MSHRAKRPNRSDDGSVPVKRRKRPTAEEEETASLAWQPRPLNDLKSIYNRTTTEAPAELFRKDLISAMKLPDSEPLANDEYWVIVDQWKQEWERGVQVPVNPDSLPEPSVTVTHCASLIKPQQEFRLPKNKYIRITKDDHFNVEEHILSTAPAQSEAACSYDLDECDVAWLRLVNGERAALGLGPISEDQLERILERLELRCWDKIQAILRNEEGLGIEYDENVICDVCRSPDSEEGNEMVFCDSCNICVHQACYGITRIPEGQWLCCTCALSQRPDCVLCPNKGGAMKCTRSGQKWAHVSCALWIPEVSIGCVEKMEPITKISSIPQSRWALICVLCRERVGACIQCSVKTCKTAYHVTCAFKHGLEMRAIIEDENADDGVKLRSYCEKHSKSSKKEKSICSGSEDDDCKRKKRKDMTSEEKNQARAARLQEIEAEFYKHVSVKDVAVTLETDIEAILYVYNYWKLKRKAGHNKPLLPPKSEDVDMLSHQQEQADLEKMKMFVQLRQDLERVRNLCYMVSRREKLSRTFFRMREQTFHKQAAVLSSAGPSLPSPVTQAVIEANHGSSIYDRLYSFNEAEDHTADFETILARIAGLKSPKHVAGEDRKPEINGLFKDVKNNPYKKMYFNGSSKRRSGSLYGSSMSSASSSDERPKENKENHLHTSSDNDNCLHNKKTTPKKSTATKIAERRRKRISITSRTKLDSSSEDDVNIVKKDWGQMSKSRLKQIENEYSMSGSDTDDLMPIKTSQPIDVQKAKAIAAIYSDSDSSDVSMKNDDKSSNAASDSQQSRLRTKAAVKEFSHKPTTSKVSNKTTSDKTDKTEKKKLKPDESKKEPPKKKDYVPVPSDLIVPQRQAAKIASENLKSTTSRVKEQPVPEHDNTKSAATEKRPKPKTKTKIVKDNNKDPPIKEVNKETVKDKDTKENAKEIKESKESRDNRENKESKEIKKDTKPNDVFDIDKELEKADQDILSYVPQRQAAIKAAEHIKSGLGKPVQTEASNEGDKTKKEPEGKVKKEEIKPRKEAEPEKPAKVEHKRKSSSNSSSSSSSSSSSDSSSSSSSESEEEIVKSQSESQLSRDLTKRTNAKDWPFLDKESKSAASSASSDSSDSSAPALDKTAAKADAKESLDKAKLARKDKKAPPEREERARVRGKGRSAVRGRQKPPNSGDRVRDVHGRVGDISDSKPGVERERSKPRKGKSAAEDDAPKEVHKLGKLLSPVRKEDKKLNEKVENEVSNLEREILERKAGREGVNCVNKVRSTLDRLFGSPDKAKTEKSQKSLKSNKSRISDKINKLPEKISKLPEKISKLTEKICKSPEKISKSPEKISKSPEKISKSPEKISKSPEKISRAPEKISKAPEKISKPSEKTGKSQDKILKSSVTKSPDKTLKSPEKTSKSSERSCKSPNHEKSINEKFSKSPVKENKEPENKIVPTRKSSSKSKCIDDIFAEKLVSTNSKAIHKKKSLPKNDKQKSDFEIAPVEANVIVDVDVPKVYTSRSEQSKIDVETSNRNLSKDNRDFTDIMENIGKSILNDVEDAKNEKLLQNRSIFSPQPHGKDDLLDFENILEDGFGISKDEEIIKGPLTFSFGNVPLFKEDSKEDSARETLNLVEKLRLELSKKSTTYDIDDSVSIASSTKNEGERLDFNEQIVPNNVVEAVKESLKTQEPPHINLNVRVEVSNVKVSESKSDDFQYNTSPQQHHNIDHSAEDRWAPPNDSYPNLQAMDIKNYTDHIPEVPQSYLQQFSENHHLLDHPPLITNSPLHKKSPVQLERQITPFNEPVSMEGASPSPYADMHPHNKWNESQLMVTRRSSSSSAVSQSSSCSRRNEVEDEMLKRQEVMLMNHTALEMAFAVLPQVMPQFPPNALENFPPYSEASQFVSPVSLFPPPNINTQLPFPSPGAAMFPPAFGAPFPGPHSVIPPMPKPVEDAMHFPAACTAAFTSSQHNMALTAAMVNIPPTPKETTPEDTPLIAAPVPEIPESPALSNTNTTPTSNHVQPSPNPSLKSNSSAGKKSPCKPTRTSARVMSNLNKSPSKSPGKSPRQEAGPKSSSMGRGRGESKRGSGKASSGRGGQMQARGRGRGRGRGRSYTQQSEYTNTIHNNLVGTVYDLDFDEDISNDNMADLRALRERRKSVDIHERKETTPHHLSRDSSPSPKFASPKTRSYNTDLRELRPPTPIEEPPVVKADLIPVIAPCEAPSKTFPDIVPPVLPGPVDMRTYNSSFEPQTYNEANLLGAFGSGAAEQQVHDDIDEELEKEFQSDLTASLKKIEEPPVPEVSNIKVSLSDSRNQLKVKIKGPIANYTSTVAPLPPVVDHSIAALTNSVSNNAINNTNANPTSNLRRMRKKELLRYYVSQDMNMDDPVNQGMSTPAAPPINRTIITIPKAVASMTTIPTKDDYRDYRFGVDDLVETKHRKETKARTGGLSRELKHLDLSLEDDPMERRRSLGSTGSVTNFSSSFDSALKRRGRPPRPQTTPKLKIKIGGNSIVGPKIDDKKSIRPPKKRLSTIAMPSVEDLKRESMKFRKRVMADFGEEKRKKKDKSEKRKKKKRKQEVQIISNKSTNPTKLIIRFGKKTDYNSDNKRTSLDNSNTNSSVKIGVSVSENNPGDETSSTAAPEGTAEGTSALRLVRSNKITPIKLKISRCQEGSGYMMKPDDTATTQVEAAAAPTGTLPLNISEIAHTPTPLPLNKDCEVR